MTELSPSNTEWAVANGRLRYTDCPKPEGRLVGQRGGGIKVAGHISDVFRDEAGRCYVRAVSTATGATIWMHITVEDAA